MEQQMKTTKRKRTVPAKRKSAVPAKQEHAVPSHETALEDRTGHWIERIEPRGTALLSQTLGPINFVIKNRSPNGVFLMAEYGDLMDLPPGKVAQRTLPGLSPWRTGVKNRR
jgi:hypothetical protein